MVTHALLNGSGGSLTTEEEETDIMEQDRYSFENYGLDTETDIGTVEDKPFDEHIEDQETGLSEIETEGGVGLGETEGTADPVTGWEDPEEIAKENLEDKGDSITDIFTGHDIPEDIDKSPEEILEDKGDTVKDTVKNTGKTVKDTVDSVADTVGAVGKIGDYLKTGLYVLVVGVILYIIYKIASTLLGKKKVEVLNKARKKIK